MYVCVYVYTYTQTYYNYIYVCIYIHTRNVYCAHNYRDIICIFTRVFWCTQNTSFLCICTCTCWHRVVYKHITTCPQQKKKKTAHLPPLPPRTGSGNKQSRPSVDPAPASSLQYRCYEPSHCGSDLSICFQSLSRCCGNRPSPLRLREFRDLHLP